MQRENEGNSNTVTLSESVSGISNLLHNNNNINNNNNNKNNNININSNSATLISKSFLTQQMTLSAIAFALVVTFRWYLDLWTKTKTKTKTKCETIFYFWQNGCDRQWQQKNCADWNTFRKWEKMCRRQKKQWHSFFSKIQIRFYFLKLKSICWKIIV